MSDTPSERPDPNVMRGFNAVTLNGPGTPDVDRLQELLREDDLVGIADFDTGEIVAYVPIGQFNRIIGLLRDGYRPDEEAADPDAEHPHDFGDYSDVQ